jgi:hypothetical protein
LSSGVPGQPGKLRETPHPHLNSTKKEKKKEESKKEGKRKERRKEKEKKRVKELFWNKTITTECNL